MSSKKINAAGASFTGTDASQLIASYHRKPDPKKKTVLLSKLQGERTAFHEAQIKASARPKTDKER